MSLATHGCACDECFQNGAGAGYHYDHCKDVENRIPFYQSLAQPLMYYTQEQTQACNKNRKAPRKANQNCFMKAFRWYTQERLSQADSASRRSDMSGFASWLDEKYNEFLQDKRSDEYWSVFPKATNEFQGNNRNASEFSKHDKRKKIAKPRSSYKNNRCRSVMSKEHRYALGSSDSLEYILKPTDLSCPASECCNQNRSRSSYQSLETLVSKKTVFRSRSFDENMNKSHNVENDGQYRNVVCGCALYEKYFKTKVIESPVKYGLLSKEVNKDVWCQCLHDRLASADAATQYHQSDNTALEYHPYISGFAEKKQVHDNFNEKSFDKNQSDVRCECSLWSRKNTQISNKKHNIICKCPKNDRQNPEQYQAKARCAKCSAGKLKEFTSYRDDKHNLSTCDGAVQSSDHSIHLESVGLHQHPFFLKIVRGDKLNQDSIQRDK